MRLTHPTIRPTGPMISFQFDGQPIDALEGETIAAALSAAGITTLRHTASGAPRGVFCGMGACFDCVVTVNGRIGQRACLTPAQDGMQVTGSFPAELTLDVAPPPEERNCDILVVGGGVAGLSAAIAAAEAGASVVVLDERYAPGGQFAKPLAPSHVDTDPDPQFRLGTDLRARVERAGVRLETGATVWGAFAPDELAAIVRGQSITYHPRRLILATGAHEAPVPVLGWTLPGVMTTGGLQTLVRTQRVSPGQRVLIAGSGPLNLQLACELLAGGITPIAVLEAAPRPSASCWRDLARMAKAAPDLLLDGWRMLRQLRQANVPLLWGTALDRLTGNGQVRTAIAGAHRFDVDVVALNMGFQPEVNLARALGVPHRFVARGAGYLASETDANGRTTVDGVFTAGDGANFGGARVAQARGRLAGLAAARDLGFAAPPDAAARTALARAEAFQSALWRVFTASPPALADATMVCRCEEVTAAWLQAEIASGLTSLPALKKATRAGMGRCQGRFCAATIARMCPGNPEPDGFAAPRAPLRPVPAAPLMREAPEFIAPLLTDPASPTRLHALPPLPVEARHADVVVIGGGAAGLSTAYFLAKGGADVLLIDRDEAAMAASTANAGSLHVQLLSYDFTDDTPEDGGPAAHTLPLAPRSIALWKAIGAAVGEDLGIRTEGGLMLAEDEAGLAWLRRKSAMERRWGIESHVLQGNELRDLAPAVSDHMVGADFVPAEGFGDPLRGMMALLHQAKAHGTRLLRGAEVQAIERTGTTWTVTTSQGQVTANRLVNATGPWAARIGRMVGLDLPVTGTVQQVIVTEPAPKLTRHLIALANRHLSLKQQASGGFLIGGGWFGDFDPATGRTSPLRRNIEGNLWVCERALPVVKALPIVRAWTGINPAIDRAPLLGEVPSLPGFYNTVTANGYTLGPAVGQITAESILHNETVDPRYTLARFG
ncbi:FAD-dependent oxidoreductase [Acidisphaera sp. S103]|uniref:FAD-dependent oxidoreductase n=1 Tax=Acidisphaera sp. S103 TaxID=1747223 RepID=UPI00131CFC4C|nr:FAD-dependent oxidoreductase [Acidisphaera sp. S103]